MIHSPRLPPRAWVNPTCQRGRPGSLPSFTLGTAVRCQRVTATLASRSAVLCPYGQRRSAKPVEP